MFVYNNLKLNLKSLPITWLIWLTGLNFYSILNNKSNPTQITRSENERRQMFQIDLELESLIFPVSDQTNSTQIK